MILSFEDKVKNAMLGGSVPDIKGRATLTLTDAKTGKRERITSDNMVTNAVKYFYETNPMGVMNFDAYLPMWRLFGGCMLFQNTLTENAGNMYPPNSDDNPLIAYANQTTHSTADAYRGNPAAVEISSNHIKIIFDWNMTQGNGTISSVALANENFMGLYPSGNAAFVRLTGRNVDGVTYSRVNEWGSGYDRNRALTCPVEIDSDGNGICLYCNGTTLEEITAAHPYVKAGLLEDPNALPASGGSWTAKYREVGTRSANLSRSFNTGYTYIGFDANNYYVMERDSGSNTKLYIDVIDKSDFTSVTAKTLTISGATLARPGVTCSDINNGIISNGSVYWLSGSDNKTFVRININNVADVEVLTASTAAINQEAQPIILNDGLILGRNYLINGSKVYPVQARAGRGLTDEVTPYECYAMYNRGPLVYQSASTDTSTYYRRYGFGPALVIPYMATVNNLGASVIKNASKTMRLEYTLTQV